jgi:hypothetical protein
MRNLTDICSASAELHRKQLSLLHLVTRWVGGPANPPKLRDLRDKHELPYDATPSQDQLSFLEQNDITK